MEDKDYEKLIIQALQKSRNAGNECPKGWDCEVEVVHFYGTTYDYCTKHYKKFRRNNGINGEQNATIGRDSKITE